MSAMTAWRTTRMCDNCPFSEDGAGKKLWDSLRPMRRTEILGGLMNDGTFMCHYTATADEDIDDEEEIDEHPLVCSGSIKWQEENGHSSNYVRIAERLEAWNDRRAEAQLLGREA